MQSPPHSDRSRVPCGESVELVILPGIVFPVPVIKVAVAIRLQGHVRSAALGGADALEGIASLAQPSYQPLRAVVSLPIRNSRVCFFSVTSRIIL